MKTTRVQCFKNVDDYYLNDIIQEYEKDGYEVSQVLTSASATSVCSNQYITIVFTKEI